MLPEQWVTAKGKLVEMRAHMPIKEEHRACRRQAGDGEEQEEGGDQGHPGEKGNAVHRETWRPQTENRHHKVQSAYDGRESQNLNPQNPEIHIRAWRTESWPRAAGDIFCQGRVTEPARVWRAPRKEANIHKDAGKQDQPIP